MGEDQVKQIEKSVRKFAKSPYSCAIYLLVHNRPAKDKQLRAKVESEVNKLIAAGKAKQVWIWDRDQFIKQIRQQLGKYISSKLAHKSDKLLELQERFFSFGSIFIPVVPVMEKRWVLRRGETPTLQQSGAPMRKTATSLVLDHNNARWAMLIGHFGTGKTTAALRAASQDGKVIYVRAQDIEDEHGGSGTHYLLKNIAPSLELFDELEDRTRDELQRLSGAAMGHLLRDPDGKFVLVIDGIDEHRSYGKAAGLMRLTNAVADLRCPILFTTRKEHFDAMFSNYQQAADTLSIRGGAKRDGRLVELLPWTKEIVLEFIDMAIDIAEGAQRKHLVAFRGTIETTNEYERLKGVLNHPLLLQMVLEQVADGEMPQSESRDLLVIQWARKKMWRDLDAPRATPIDVIDRGAFIEQMMELMKRIAVLMTDTSGGERVLRESLSSTILEEEARKIFCSESLDASTIVTNSLLVPVSERQGKTFQVRFFHRLFHESFLGAKV